MTRAVTLPELGEFFELRSQSFSLPYSDRDDWLHRIEADVDAACIGTFDGDRLLAALRVLPGGQWWLRRSLPMGGIAAVVVRPEARGRGVARSLLHGALDWMRTAGIAVSALHPASTRVYRSSGWELAGREGILRVPTRSAAAIRVGADLAVDRLTLDDLAAMRACYADVALRTHGALDRSSSYWHLVEATLDSPA
ncbi:MAG: GNAT family N-acetyltransferase, partial [Acidimicrobiia bacterium]